MKLFPQAYEKIIGSDQRTLQMVLVYLCGRTADGCDRILEGFASFEKLKKEGVI